MLKIIKGDIVFNKVIKYLENKNWYAFLSIFLFESWKFKIEMLDISIINSYLSDLLVLLIMIDMKSITLYLYGFFDIIILIYLYFCIS